MFDLEDDIYMDNMAGILVVFLTSSILESLFVYHRMLVDILPYFLRRYFSYALGLMPMSSKAF